MTRHEHFTAEQSAAWQAVTTVYSAYIDRDEQSLVSVFADEATLWDSAHRDTRTGREMKQAARSAHSWRTPLTLRAMRPVVTVWGDTALVLHDLEARFADPAENEDLRVTAVLRNTPQGWLIVHHHEEKLAAAADGDAAAAESALALSEE